MHRIEAEFEVVTPMFLGGADPKGAAELRAASLKGALRFWWRALAWGRLGDLAEIHKQEMKLFGSADRAVGQASFSLAAAWVNQAPLLVAPPARDDKSALPNVAQEERRRLKRKHRLTLDGSRDANAQAVGPGARYLGFALTEAFGRTQRSDPRDRQSPVIDVFVPAELSRPCLFHKNEAGQPATFRIVINSRCPLPDDLVQAAKLFGLLGGLGARTRRGWGSLALTALKVGQEVVQLPTTADEYQRQVRDLITECPLATAPPPYSAFFDKARVLILKEGDTALDVLDDLGDTFQLYRGWRHPADCPRHRAAEQNFPHDHHGKAPGAWSIPAGSFDGAYPAAAQDHPLRVEFGLPHNYDQRLNIEAEGHDRRASPLLFHIHPVGDKYCAVATFLPTPFLPSRPADGPRKIRIKRKIGSGWVNADVDNRVDYGVIQRFLFGFTPPGSSTKRDYFDGTRRVIL